jgi:hypothetical protein
METRASQASLLTARLSIRVALFKIFKHLKSDIETNWYRRQAQTDRNAIAATILDRADRSCYLGRTDFKDL